MGNGFSHMIFPERSLHSQYTTIPLQEECTLFKYPILNSNLLISGLDLDKSNQIPDQG